MIRTICSRLWKGRKQNRGLGNNRGSSLAMVLMVMGIVSILGMLVLSTTLVTFEMKRTYSKSAGNFYDAESVMDAIRVGLMQDVAAASGYAYSSTLENYGNLDEAARRQMYMQNYKNELLRILSNNNPTGYRIEHLMSLVPDAVKTDAVNKTSTMVPLVSSANVFTDADSKVCGYLNQNAEKGTFTLKDVLVRYVDKDDYMTEIRSDIVLSCPQIDFANGGSQPMDLTNYALIASESMKVGGGEINIKGNAYLGSETGGAELSFGTVNFLPTVENSGGKLVTGGTFLARSNASVTVGGGLSLWAHELMVDTADLTVDGVIYLNDDFVLTRSLSAGDCKATLTGRLYAYGNPDTAMSADAFISNDSIKDLPGKYPANYSSAILLNGRNTTLDMSGLEDLILAGTAYVSPSGGEGERADLQMGESLAFKTNQRAYLVPSEYIGNKCVNGGINPMTKTTYDNLVAELKVKNGTEDVQPMDFVRDSSDGMRFLSDNKVSDLQIGYYRSGGIQMVYFFLKFDSEKDAVNFSNHYYDSDKLSALNGRIQGSFPNTTLPGVLESELAGADPDEEISDYTFYYNGSMVVANSSQTRVLPGQCTRASGLSAQNLAMREREYQNIFSSLAHCLNDKYDRTTVEQRKKSVYKNLVKDLKGFTGTESGLNFTDGEKRVYSINVAGGAQMCAVVVNGDYVVTGTDGPDNLPVHLVIASGSVKIDSDFQGLIIAENEISFKNAGVLHVEAASNLVQQALKIEDANGIRPVDYLINGECYLVDANGVGGNGYEMIDYSKYVTYKNWVKQ